MVTASSKFANADISFHTSGHAYPELIEQVIRTVNPTDAVIPIHTDAPEAFRNLDLPDELRQRMVFNL